MSVGQNSLRYLALSVAVLAWLIYAWPTLRYIWNLWDGVPTFNESLGYRYFFALRNIEGARDFTHPGQGPLIGLIGNAIFRVLRLIDADPTNALPLKILLFGYATTGLNLVLMLGVLGCVSLDRRLSILEKTAFASLPLTFEYGWYFGYWFTVTPDYYVYGETLLVLWAYAARNLQLSYRSGSRPERSLAFAAFVAGATIALKITYGIAPLAIIAAVVLTRPIAEFSRKLKDLCVLALISGGTYAFLILAYYGGSIRDSLRFARLLLGWGAGISGSDTFVAEFLHIFTPWNRADSYLYVWISLFITVAFIVFSIIRTSITDRRVGLPSPIPVAAFAVLVISTCFTLYRSSPAAAFELSTILPVLALVSTFGQNERPGQRRVLMIFIACCLGVPGRWAYENRDFIANYTGIVSASIADEKKFGGNWRDQLYEWNRQQNLPIVVLMPSNLFPVGSVEDMMMRGLSGMVWSSWYDSNTNRTKEKIFPRYFFISHNSTKQNGIQIESSRTLPMPESYVFIWTMPGEHQVPAESDRAIVLKQKEYVHNEGYASLLATPSCRTWSPTNMLAIHSCTVRLRKRK